MIKLKNLTWQPIPVDASDVGKDNLHFGPREEKTVANRYGDSRDVQNKIDSGYLRKRELKNNSTSSDDEDN